MRIICNLHVQHDSAYIHRIHAFWIGIWFKSEVLSALRRLLALDTVNDDYVTELKGRLQTAHEIASQKWVSHKMKSKEYYDKNTELAKYKVGQKVLLYDETVCKGWSRKLSPQYIGLYETIAVNRVNATIKKGHNTQQVHVNRLKPIY